jgi:hypothetical protein
MSKNKNRPRGQRKGPVTVRHYDVEMIRDFLDHLMWEVRVRHFEYTAAHDTLNPDLCAQLGRYMRKWHCAGLLVGNSIAAKPDDMTAEVYASQIATISAGFLRQATEWLAHLEALNGLFEQALGCASAPNVCFQRIIDMKTWPPEEPGAGPAAADAE